MQVKMVWVKCWMSLLAQMSCNSRIIIWFFFRIRKVSPTVAPSKLLLCVVDFNGEAPSLYWRTTHQAALSNKSLWKFRYSSIQQWSDCVKWCSELICLHIFFILIAKIVLWYHSRLSKFIRYISILRSHFVQLYHLSYITKAIKIKLISPSVVYSSHEQTKYFSILDEMRTKSRSF